MGPKSHVMTSNSCYDFKFMKGINLKKIVHELFRG